jgi:hypothetical protein
VWNFANFKASAIACDRQRKTHVTLLASPLPSLRATCEAENCALLSHLFDDTYPAKYIFLNIKWSQYWFLLKVLVYSLAANFETGICNCGRGIGMLDQSMDTVVFKVTCDFLPHNERPQKGTLGNDLVFKLDDSHMTYVGHASLLFETHQIRLFCNLLGKKKHFFNPWKTLMTLIFLV